jgi:predicted permease
MLEQAVQGIVFLTAGIIGYLSSSLRSLMIILRITNLLNSWIIIPLLFYLSLLERGIGLVDLNIFLVLLTYVMIAFPILILLTKRLPSDLRGSVIMESILMNSVNLPFSLLLVIKGSYSFAALYAAGVTTIRPFLAYLTYAIVYSKDKRIRGRINLPTLLPIISTILGGMSHGFISLPQLITNTIVILGVSLVIYNFGITLGMTGLSLKVIKAKQSLIVIMFRSFLCPLLTLIFSNIYLKGENEAIREILLTSAMPPAVTDAALARIYSFNVQFTVTITTFLTPINGLEGVLLYYLLS